jgi:hypothetical protein
LSLEEARAERIGSWRVIRRIGEGGYGVVFLAERRNPRQQSAIKLIRPGMDSRAVLARFEAERQALAIMTHPNIARLLESGVHDGRPYFAMEYVSGVSITEYCDRLRMPIPERLRLFLQVCQAVQHAHLKAVIHRDISANNVMVTEVDGKPVVKVIDFGIAKALGQKLTDLTLETAQGAVIGNYGYMSPEQADPRADVDSRTDVYSLGVLLYELLAGERPFDAKQLQSAGELGVSKLIREEEPPRPSTKLSTLENRDKIAERRQTRLDELVGTLEGELEWIPLMAMRKERERRYQTAEALGQDIEAYLEGRALKAASESASYRMKKWIRRNRAAAVFVATVGMLLLAGLVGTSWGLVNAERARREAERARGVAEQQSKMADTARAEAEQARLNAERSRDAAETALRDARRAVMASQARLLIAGDELKPALEKAIEAYKFRGAFEDGQLLGEVLSAARDRFSLAGQITLPDGPPSAATVMKWEDQSVAVMGSPSGLTLVRMRDMQVLGQAGGESVTGLWAPFDPSSPHVVALTSGNDLVAYSIPDLKAEGRLHLETKPSDVSLGIDSAAVVDSNGVLQVLRVPSMKVLARINLPEVDPRRRSGGWTVAVNPSGTRVYMHSGSMTMPGLVWTASRGVKEAMVRAARFAFVDESHLLGWQSDSAGAGDVTDELLIHEFTDDAEKTLRSLMVPGLPTRGMRSVRVGRGRNGVLRAVLIGQIGEVQVTLDDDFIITQQVAVRYDSVWPLNPPASALCTDARSGLMLLRSGTQTLLFGPQELSLSSVRTRNFDLGITPSWLLKGVSGATEGGLIRGLSLTSPTDAPFEVRYRSDANGESGVYAWAMSATPDLSTVAVVLQQSLSGDDQVTAKLGLARIRVLRRATASEPYRVVCEAPIGLPRPTNPFDARVLAVDPTGRSAIYWVNSVARVVRVSLTDGGVLNRYGGRLDVTVTPDGSIMASRDSEGHVVVTDTVTGEERTYKPGRDAKKVTLSSDGKGVIVGGDDGATYVDIATMTPRWTAPIRDPVLAYLAGADRFVVFRDQNAKGAGAIALGSAVLVDRQGELLSLLSQSADKNHTQATFVNNGSALVVQDGRWTTRMFYNLSPQRLQELLTTPRLRAQGRQEAVAELPRVTSMSPEHSRPTTAAAEVLEFASDDPKIAEHLGEVVRCRGKIKRVQFTMRRDALNLMLEGPDETCVMIWVPSMQLSNFKSAVGSAPEDLEGRSMTITGRLIRFAGKVEAWKHRVQFQWSPELPMAIGAPEKTPDKMPGVPPER